MVEKTPYPKPNGSVAKWSQTQAERWIKSQVRTGNVRFSFHAEHEKAPRFNISPDEALSAILKGRSSRWEPGEKPKTRAPTMNMTFEQALRSHSINVVTAIADDDADVVVVTLWIGNKL